MSKILILVQGLKIGGLENVVCNLSRDIRDFDIEICCFDSLGVYSEELEKKGIKVSFLPRKKGVDWLYALRLSKFIKSQRIDIIHAHNFTAWFYAGLAGFLSDKKVVYTEHDNSYASSRHVRLISNLLKRKTAKVITVSQNVKSTFEKYSGVKEVEVVYNGIDKDVFKPVDIAEKNLRRKQYGFSENDILLGMVGRIDKLKNQRCLIEVLPELIGKFGQNTKLILIGDGCLKESLQGKVKNMHLDKNVNFMGERSDIAGLLPVLDVFLLPSLAEGLPVSVIEAMACGLAIVASRVGGIPELIQDGENGILIDPKKKEDLLQAIIKLLNDKEQRQIMGQRARNKFIESFSLDRMINNYQAIYKDLECAA